jgi:CheY-like chemotaxis protein
MPLINGLRALEYLRESAETRMIPILFLTGEASANVAPHLSSEPRVAHVKKPIDLEDLNSLVHQLLDKYPIDNASA